MKLLEPITINGMKVSNRVIGGAHMPVSRFRWHKGAVQAPDASDASAPSEVVHVEPGICAPALAALDAAAS